MATTPFSLRLDAETKKRLDKNAKARKRPASFVVQEALNHYLDAQDHFRAEMEQALAEADKGVFISSEAMHRWMASWDTDNEQPAPEPDIFPGGRKA
ncbi:MAG: ribbon-helix-helix protein, CopG family [Hyphomicrobiales bacterium]